MTEYSHRAQVGRAYLKADFNDIDVFVEDETCQNMYVRIINRLLQGKWKVTAVYPLGNRNAVIARCQEDQTPRKRRRLYLIDGDLDRLTGRRCPRLEHFYRLRVYCVENLLLSEAAFLLIAEEGSPNEPSTHLLQRLAYSAVIDKTLTGLIPLYVLYAVINLLQLKIPSISRSVFRLYVDQNDPLSMSESLVYSEVRQVLTEIMAGTTRAKYRRAKARVIRRLRKYTGDYSSLVSAKKHLLPPLHTQLHKTGNARYRTDELKVRLALHCDNEVDRELGRTLRRIMQSEPC